MIDDYDLDAFRARALAWLDENAERRSIDAVEAKRRLASTTHSSLGDERAAVEGAKRWQQKVHEAGFAGIAVPTEYGGRGLTPAHAEIWRQALRSYVTSAGPTGIGNALALPAILRHGTEEQKHRHIPGILSGDTGWCQLFSEPGAGSDLAGLTTRAERDGDGWVVNGQKVWNSFAHLADWGLLLARTNWDVPKHRGITYFLVDMRTPGVEPRPLRQATGAAEFNETFLTDVVIPDDGVLGGVGDGWTVVQTTLSNERAGLSGVIGFSGIPWEAWVELARKQGRLEDPAIRRGLVDLYTRTQVISWLAQRSAAAAEAGFDPGPQSSVMKLLGSIDIARGSDLAMEILASGAMLHGHDAFEDGCWQQLFLGQWSPRIGGGTEQIQRNVIGERILGLPHEPRADKGVPFRDVMHNA